MTMSFTYVSLSMPFIHVLVFNMIKLVSYFLVYGVSGFISTLQ